jgi:hypothetical protein
MMLGCCHCEAPFLPFQQSSIQSSSDVADSVPDTDVGCAACVGGVVPARYRLTFEYEGTGNASTPCCDEYADKDEYICVYRDPLTTGDPSTCLWTSDEKVLQQNKAGNCIAVTSPNNTAFKRAYVQIRGYPAPNTVSLRAAVLWNYQQANNTISTLGVYYAALVSTPVDCLTSFTLNTGRAEWWPQPVKWIYVGPCGPKANETIPATVTIEPA